ncbi:MAG: hypothetical protein P4M08_15165 [Oligoflexia bacterium]|nr:hypothetical protein [Oligoflexia bacterium]
MTKNNGFSALIALFFLTSCALSQKSSSIASSTSGVVAISPTSNSILTSTSSTASTSNTAPFVFNVSASGYTSTSVTVQAGQILRLTFAPSQASTLSNGSSTVYNYSALGVYITVGSLTLPSTMLTNGYGGTTAERSPVLDFSPALTGCTSGTSSGTACRTSVTITISSPNSNYWCLIDGQMCPWNRVSQGQTWGGTLTVETDDTQAVD